MPFLRSMVESCENHSPSSRQSPALLAPRAAISYFLRMNFPVSQEGSQSVYNGWSAARRSPDRSVSALVLSRGLSIGHSEDGRRHAKPSYRGTDGGVVDRRSRTSQRRLRARPRQACLEELQTIARGWSVTKRMLGKPVYNAKNEKVGDVDDLIIAPDSASSYAIIGVGGFLGLGERQVAVPANHLKHTEGRIVLPDATKEALLGHAVIPIREIKDASAASAVRSSWE